VTGSISSIPLHFFTIVRFPVISPLDNFMAPLALDLAIALGYHEKTFH